MLLFTILLFSSPPASGTTLIESAATVGIMNTLQQNQQKAGTKQLEKAKNAGEQYQEAISKRTPNEALKPPHPTEEMALNRSPNQAPRNAPQGFIEPPSYQEDEESYQENEEIEDFNDDIVSEKIPVNYKAKTIIFYKKECEEASEDCKNSHPVLTNIRSVIFNHAQGRLISSESEK